MMIKVELIRKIEGQGALKLPHLDQQVGGN